MKLLRTSLLLPLLLLLGTVYSQTWRSTLYPTNWSPSGNFYTDKIIQDFSYAGYHRGEKSIPVITTNIKDVTASPYLADKTGATDVTAKIQKAIDDVSAAGGGVVYLPAGTYKVSPGANNQCLLIKSSNVILRGAGKGLTKIVNSSYIMQGKSIIKVQGASSWYGTETNKTLIAKDLTGPTKEIPVKSATGYAVGDMVIVRNYVGDAWINEHKMPLWLGNGDKLKGNTFCRQILKVDAANNILTIDAPIRYTLLTRDNSAVYKINGMISEVGVESLSIGNVQNPSTTGWGEEDYTDATKASFNSHNSYAVILSNVHNGWVDNVSSFQPAGNTSTAHLLSNGLLLSYCKNTTVQNCYFSRPQFGGGGGNGYMYRVTGSENLVQNCTSEFSRHGLVFSSMCTSGNVYHKCTDINTGSATGATGYYRTSGSGSDHHMHFSASNLIDQCTSTDSYFAAGFRNYGGTPIHGITAAHSVYWNTVGNGSKFPQVVFTQQGRYGYAIGTSGANTKVNTSEMSLAGSASITSPIDHVEGIGTGATLVPQSLFLDQKSKRLNATDPCASNVLPAISLTGTSSSSIAPATVTLSATATDADGTVSKVEFYSGTTLLTTKTAAPYTHSIANVAAGTYSYTAKVTDNCGVAKSSTAVSITLTAPTTNLPPSIALTSPTATSRYTAPASIVLTATANDADGTISNVEFYNGTSFIGSDATSPYSITWPSVAAGTYVLTAKATDNKGAVKTSTSVSVTVSPAQVGDILGNDCLSKNTSGVYAAAASIKVNATSYGWWYTGSTQSITAVTSDNSKATLVTGTGFSAGNVCVGVNYSVSPWYKQYCKAITVCGARMDASMLMAEMETKESFAIAPNPSNSNFTLVAPEGAASVLIFNANGMEVYKKDSPSEGQTVSFGDQFSPGLYSVKILYTDGRIEIRKVQKVL